jgi:5-methylcytosine-specific restriction endonuclease McrA
MYDTKKQQALSREANKIPGYGVPWSRKKRFHKHQKKKANSRRKRRQKCIPKFFYTAARKELRYQALKRDGGRCQLCGRSAQDGIILNVDHIKPRHKIPAPRARIIESANPLFVLQLGKGGR